MKAGKILLIIQTCFMYLSMILFIIAIAIAFKTENNPELESVVEGLYITRFVINFIPLGLSFATFVVAFVSIFKSPRNSTNYTAIIKIILIPWYICNFVEWTIYGVGMLNPFLMVLGILLVFFGIVFTYVFMLATSAYNIGYVFSLIRTGKASKLMIVALVFHFIFMLDVVGAIMLHTECKKIGEVNEN